MMRSMSSAIAGLRSHQTKMDVIGNNIANVNTNGFKASRMTFSDVYYQTLNAGRMNASGRGGTNPTQLGYGSQVSTVDMFMTNGGGQFTGRPYDAYIDGDGYFTVVDANGMYQYTRMGNLTFDEAGCLVDYSGNKVIGFRLAAGVDGYKDGKAIPPSSGGFYSIATDSGNLVEIVLGAVTGSSIPSTGAGSPVGKSIRDYITNISIASDGTITAVVNNIPDILGSSMVDVNTYPTGDFNIATNPGGGYDVTTPTGEVITITQAEWDAAVAANPPELAITNGTLTWTLPVDAADVGAGVVNKSYKLTTPTLMPTTTKGNIVYEGATFENNEAIYLGKIAVATFSNPFGLRQTGNSYFSEAPNSGMAKFTEAGRNGAGETKAGYLEMSNVELAQEFTDLITTQRGFQANTRVITVSDEMLAELVNLKR